jgi:dGTPase
MKKYGGFEHNLQSLRVVDQLEERYAEFSGLNLTFEAREGILKHCSLSEAKKLGALGYRFIHKLRPSLEAQVTDLADAIAYNNHDLDDGLRSGLITMEALREQELFAIHFEQVSNKWSKLSLKRTIYETIRGMINYQIVDLIECSQQHIAKQQPQSIDDIRNSAPLIQLSGVGFAQHRALKIFLKESLYRHYRVHRMGLKAKTIISSLFDVFMSDNQLLPTDVQARIQSYQQQKQPQYRQQSDYKARMIADYIAGMTDRFAISEYEKLFNPLTLT